MNKKRSEKNLKNAKKIGLGENGKFKDGVYDKFLWIPRTDLKNKRKFCALKECGKEISRNEKFVCLEDSKTYGDLVALFHVDCFKKMLKNDEV